MIKINLLAEKRPAKKSKAPSGVKVEGLGSGRNVML